MASRAAAQSVECDVLVIGAGPAGAAAATVLAQAGLEVVVADRASFPRDKTCGDAVSSGAMELLEELGAAERVRKGPHALVHAGVAFFPDATRIARRYERPGYIVPRLALDACVRDAAESNGARILEGVSLTGLIHEHDRVTGARGPELQALAKVVIAADGYASLARAEVGSKPAEHPRTLAVSTTGYYRGVRFPHASSDADHYFEHDLPCGYGWVFPAVEGVANVGVYLRKDAYDETRAKLSDLLGDFLARHPERFAEAERVGPLRTWSLPLAPAPHTASAPGLLLCGDAASFVDPLSGEGIWQALFSGMLAARTALSALREHGELRAEDCARYERACDSAIRGPSRKKRLAQDALRMIVDRKLYRMPPVRGALRWAYGSGRFDLTKSGGSPALKGSSPDRR